MEVYKWTDDLKTGNSKIDADHKLIISKAQELNEALSKGKGADQITATLDFLQKYVKTHFADEEKIQLDSKYPNYAEHKKNHTYFVTELDKLANKIRQNPSNIVNVMELNHLISGWFFKHIKRLDVEVAHHIQK